MSCCQSVTHVLIQCREGLPRKLFRFRRHKSQVFRHPYHLYTSSSPMQRIPDFQQDALGIFSPLMIPESQFFNAILIEPLFALPIMPVVFWHPMLRAIQLNGQLCPSAIKVQKILPRRMLTAELETRKPSGAERAPKLFFLLGLFSAKPARIVFRIHPTQNILNGTNDQSPLPGPLPAVRGEGEELLLQRLCLGRATCFQPDE